jgi:hypothetical protein
VQSRLKLVVELVNEDFLAPVEDKILPRYFPKFPDSAVDSLRQLEISRLALQSKIIKTITLQETV